MSNQAELKASSFELEESVYEVHSFDIKIVRRPLDKNTDRDWLYFEVSASVTPMKPDIAKVKVGFAMKENEEEE